MNAAEWAVKISDDILAAAVRRIRPRQDYEKIHASSIGDPCPRWLYYELTQAREKAAITPEKQLLFEGGHWQAEATMADLRAAGYTPLAQEVVYDVAVPGGKISGMVDFFLELDGQRYPCEHKGLSYGMSEVDDWRDMLDSSRRWIRRYPAQVQTYLYQTNSEEGLMLLRGKESCQVRILPVSLDYEYVEGLLKKAEDVFLHATFGEPPDRIPYAQGWCNAATCDYHHLCQPEQAIVTDQEGIVLDEALVLMVNDYLGLESAIARGTKLKAAITAMAKALGPRTLLIGEGVIMTEMKKRRCKAVEAKAAHVEEYLQTKIKNSNRSNNNGNEEDDGPGE